MKSSKILPYGALAFGSLITLIIGGAPFEIASKLFPVPA